LTAAKFIIIGLALDLLQYVVATLVWGIFNRRKEDEGLTAEDKFDAPRQLNWPALFFFWSKIPMILIAYGYILQFLINRITK